jgi:hypothetical protein
LLLSGMISWKTLLSSVGNEMEKTYI